MNGSNFKAVKPKVCLLPFGYPNYPLELLERFTGESRDMLNELGLEVTTSPIVIEIEDAAKARQALESQRFDCIIPLILSWIEVPNVIESLQGYLHLPLLLWSHTMWQEGGELLTLGPIPAAAVMRQTFEDMALSFRFVYGMPGEEQVQQEIKLFALAASAAHKLQHSRIGLVGYPSMGMYTGMMDPLALRQQIGPEVDQVDQYILIKKIEEISDERVQPLIVKAQGAWTLSDRVKTSDLSITLKMYLALSDLAQEHHWDALTIKCQYELSKYYHHTPCVPLSMLGDDLTVSCEGDLPLIATQLAMHYLSGEIATYGDLHTVDGNKLLVGACGFAPFGLAEGRPKVDVTETIYEGLANCTLYREGRVTLARLNNGRRDGFKMQLETGEARVPPPFHEIGCLPYPAMQVTLDGSGSYFAQHVMSQHYALVYGDITKEMEEFCRIKAIAPIRSTHS